MCPSSLSIDSWKLIQLGNIALENASALFKTDLAKYAPHFFFCLAPSIVPPIPLLIHNCNSGFWKSLIPIPVQHVHQKSWFKFPKSFQCVLITLIPIPIPLKSGIIPELIAIPVWCITDSQRSIQQYSSLSCLSSNCPTTPWYRPDWEPLWMFNLSLLLTTSFSRLSRLNIYQQDLPARMPRS